MYTIYTVRAFIEKRSSESGELQKSMLQKDFAAELGASLGEEFAIWVNNLPQEIFQQIEVLHQPSVLNPNRESNHWDYELNMIRAITKVKEKVLQFFEIDSDDSSDFLKELILMIVVSDIGKAGPIQYKALHAAAVVPRIYNNLILESKHGEAVRAICEQAVGDTKKRPGKGDVKDLETLAEVMTMTHIKRILRRTGNFFSIVELRKLFSIYHWWEDTHERERLNAQLTAFLVHQNATAMPIELAMIVASKIALQDVNGQQTILSSSAKDIQACLQLRRNEIQFLKKYGFDTETTSIGYFYSKGHVVFGKEYLLSLKSKLSERLLNRSLLGLQHHFVQGVSPDSKEEVMQFVESSKTNNLLKRDLHLIAFLEMLDKVEAAMHRPPFGNPFASEDPKIFLKAIQTSLSANYREHEEYLFSVYQKVFTAMTAMGIFQIVKGNAP